MSTDNEPDRLWTTDEVRALFGDSKSGKSNTVKRLRANGITHVSRRGVNGQLEWDPDDIRDLLAKRGGEVDPDATPAAGCTVLIPGGRLPYVVEEIDEDGQAHLRAEEPLKRGQPATRVTPASRLRVLK